MKSNKLLDLITALSKPEIHKVRLQLSLHNHDKNKYIELFNFIVKSDINIITKEEIFTKIYHIPYTDDKDYLLRNLYRNLSRKIEDILIQESFHKTIKNNLNIHNYFLLKSFKNLGLYNLFNKSFKESVNNAITDGDYLMASSINSLQINNYMYHIAPKTKTLEEANDLLSYQMAYLSAYYLNNQYKVAIKKKQIENSIKVSDQKNIVPENYLDKNEKLYENYLGLKYEVFGHEIPDMVNHLKNCLSILKKLPKTFKDVKTEIQFCNISLAHEYTLSEKFEEANIIYLQLFKKPQVIDTTLKTTLIFDYISNLIRLENYKLALKKVLELETSINANIPALHFKLKFLKLILYAFLKDDALLHTHVPTCNDLIDYEKNTCRFLHSIIAYLRDDFANAHRECLNLKNSLRYKGSKFDVRDILNFYIRFYNLHKNNIDNKEHLLKGLSKLNKDMLLYSENSLPEFKEYLPFLWLQKEVLFKI